MTFPGVYVEEVPSGPRAIVAAPTSVAAFVGRARRGPTDAPRTVRSFVEFERAFGALWSDSTMSHAVRHFFLEGGREAVICRVHHGATTATCALTPGLQLEAANAGAWGSQLRLRIEPATRAPTASEVAGELFTLVVKDGGTGVIERFADVSVRPAHARCITQVLADSSQLVRVAIDAASRVPAVAPPPHGASPAGVDVFDHDASSTAFTGGGDGGAITNDDIAHPALAAARRGLWMLEHADGFNLLCIPPVLGTDGEVLRATWDAAAAYAVRRRAMLLVDAPASWTTTAHMSPANVAALISPGDHLANVALYVPRIRAVDPLHGNATAAFPACGAIAGVYARTDTQRGVWKVPGGLDARIMSALDVTMPLTDAEQAPLNKRGINALRVLPRTGPVVWGTRTLHGDDTLGSEWKYIPVRRTALHIEESLHRSLAWVVFEPNGEPLWAQIRQSVNAFLHAIFQQGAFQGATPREAYFVRCGHDTMTASDIAQGRVIVEVGFAPLKPAEFVLVRVQFAAVA